MKVVRERTTKVRAAVMRWGGVGGGEGRTKSYFVILFPAHYTGSAAQPSVATTARKEEEKKRK
jgi:hypothetical protein